jgi:hypothetical protein
MPIDPAAIATDKEPKSDRIIQRCLSAITENEPGAAREAAEEYKELLDLIDEHFAK